MEKHNNQIYLDKCLWDQLVMVLYTIEENPLKLDKTIHRAQIDKLLLFLKWFKYFSNPR